MDGNFKFLLDGAPASALNDLLECARPTLRNFEMNTTRWPQLPASGVHSLSKVLFNKDETTPMVFPNLQSFSLGSIIMSTQPFIDFIAAQPKVSSLEVRFVYLGTPNLGWLDVAAALPATVQKWTVGRIGHEPIAGFEPPLPYSWIQTWRTWENPLFRAPGWEGTPEYDNPEAIEAILTRTSTSCR